jgi:hypothetical protein
MPSPAPSSVFRATKAEGSGSGDCRRCEGCRRRKGAAVRAAAVSSGGVGSAGARERRLGLQLRASVMSGLSV